VKSGGRGSILLRGLFLLLTAAPICRGGSWDFTPPGDPQRSWGVSLATGVQYDDNFNATEFDRQSGLRYTSDLNLRTKFPWERLLVSGQYDYGVVYPNNNDLGGVNQSHTLNLSANYSVNPRLFLSLNENLVNSIQPQLVQGPSGAPTTIIQAGTYFYDQVGATVSYSLTPRWSANVSGSWDIWRYQEEVYATNYDHTDYSATISALYSLSSRTVLGMNFQYAEDTYSNPGFKNGLNAYSNTGYLSLTHQFNPKVALVLNGGYTVRNSEDGSTSTGPSGYGSLIYNYGPLDTISLAVAQTLSSASIQVTRSYSAQQTTSFDLQVNHRFTVRLHSAVEVSYSYNSFTALLLNQQFQLQNATPNDESITGHWSVRYDFRPWLTTGLDYYYTQQISSNVNLVQPYSRDQIGVSVTLIY